MEEPAKIVKTKLFIGNLDPATQTEELNELCAPFGTVLEASVIKDYGFVHYGSVEEAEKAAYALNNKEFHGKRLRVELSTSTVRHRPGQPEPASALRHSSRARGALKGANGNGTARYGADAAGVGPVRHGSSSWARHEAHPYGSVPIPHGAYDRSRPYDMRPDAQRFFDDRRDNGYPPGYDVPGYPGGDADRARHYRDMPPLPPADDYGRGRSYDRHLGAPPADPYYNSGLPHGPPPPMDPYPGYEAYQKYYGGRGRDSEYAGQRDYDPYSSYRNGSYAAGAGSGPARHDMPAGLQPPPPPPGAYSSSHRQPHSYGSAPTGLDPYYGARQR